MVKFWTAEAAEDRNSRRMKAVMTIGGGIEMKTAALNFH
jgi:hypothetical protein